MSKSVANATANIYINGVSADHTLKELRESAKKLRNELSTLSPTSTEFVEKSKRLKEVDGRIQQINGELKQTKGLFGQMQAEIGKFGMLAVGYLGFDAITGKIGNIIQRNADLSDSLADVRKTTGMTDDEVKELNKSLKEFDTRTSRKELLALARDAGKLGITGTKDVEAFVRAADKINVALGEDLGQDALTQIGKLVNVFRLKEKFGLEDAMLKVASSMNTLGASSEASEGYLVNFLNRMGGIAPMANISIDEVLALGATLDSLGQASEVSSTALSKLFINMAKEAQQYAKIAGVSTDEFKQKMNDNALEAFLMVLEGAGKTEGGIIELTATLGDLGIEGGRATGVFGALAKNTDLLRSQMDIAKQSFDEGTSVIEEFNTKNTNLAANLDKVKKWIAGAFTSGPINQFFGDLVSWMAKVINTPLSEKMEKERMELRKVELQILDVNTKQSDRIKLIKQLQADYPGFLANIEAEKVSNTQLTAAVSALNNELINKIILQKQDEKIQAKSEEIAKFRMNLFEKEDALRAKLVRVAEKNNITLKEGMSLAEQARYVYQKLDSGGDAVKNLTSGRRGLALAFNAYRMALQAVNREEENNTNLINERAELEKRLGIQKQDASAVEAASLVTTDTETNESVSTGLGSESERKKAFETAKQQLEQHFNVERALIKGKQVEDLKNKEQYDTELKELELRKLNGMRELNAMFGEDVTALDVQIMDQRLAIAQDYLKREDDARKLALEQLQIAIDEEEALINENFANGLISEQDRELQLLELKRGSLESQKLIYEAYGMDVSAIEKKITELKAEELKKREKGDTKYTKSILRNNAELMQAEAELAMAKANSFGQILDMMMGFAQRHTALYKAMFLVQKAAAISEVIMRAQQEKWAISAKYAILPGGELISAALRQAINIRMGTSIAMIAGQTIAEFAGFEEGGYTGRGFGRPDKSGSRIAGVVHQDEYVTPAWMVRSPKYANVIQWLEQERTNKSSSSGNSSSGYSVGGLASVLSARKLENRIKALEEAEEVDAPVNKNEILIECRDLLIEIRDSMIKQRAIGDDEIWKLQERTQKLNKYQQNGSMG